MKSITIGKTNLNKYLIRFIFVLFLISGIFEVIGIAYRSSHKYNEATSMYVIDKIENEIKDLLYVDEYGKYELTRLLDEFNKRNNNGVYYVSINKYAQSSYIHFNYKKDEPKNFLHMIYEGKNGWRIHYGVSEEQANIDYIKQKDVPRNNIGEIANYLFFISSVGLAIFVIIKALNKNISA
jgi:hypothetical protein